MRYVLISDRHAWPNEIVAMLAASGIAGVAGNYDSTVATDGGRAP